MTSVDLSLTADYLRLVRRKNMFGFALLVLLTAAAGLSLHVGLLRLPWPEIFSALWNWDAAADRTAHVIQQIRLPRVTAAVLALPGQSCRPF